MVNEVRTHLVGGPNESDMRSAPRSALKQEFGKRLYKKMISRGWTQSELARHANQKRNNISTYVRGMALPSPQNLTLLAKALGCSEEELLPNYVESAIEQENPAFEMKVSTANPAVAWLRVNRLVSVKTAAEILSLLESEHATDRGGNG